MNGRERYRHFSRHIIMLFVNIVVIKNNGRRGMDTLFTDVTDVYLVRVIG